MARDLAGFTPGQGDLLRRALGSKRATEAIDRLTTAFVSGAVARDVPAAIAEQVFDALRAFGGYSFAKSHAAAFAMLVYRSAWLKTYHPQAFYAALLNHQPMGFWQPAIVANDAKRRGDAGAAARSPAQRRTLHRRRRRHSHRLQRRQGLRQTRH